MSTVIFGLASGWCCVVELLIGQESMCQTHKHIMQNDSDSGEAKDLITRCLVVDASKRISASQLMKHPWMMRKNDPKSLWKKKLIRSGRSLTEHLSDYQKRRKALRAKVRIYVVRTEADFAVAS